MKEFVVIVLRAVVISLLMGLASTALADTETYQFEDMQAANEDSAPKHLSVALENVAEHFEEKRWGALYASSAGQVRSAMSKKEFVRAFAGFDEAVSGFQDIEILEVFVVEFDDEYLVDQRYQTEANGSIVMPDGVLLNSPIPGYQAFALGKIITDNGEWPTWLTLMLNREKDEWKFMQFMLNPAVAAGHDGPWFSQKSKMYESSGQPRNAYFYNEIAMQVSTPSSAIRPTMLADMGARSKSLFPEDLPLSGSVDPKNWQINDDLSVEAFLAKPVITGVMIWLEIRYKTDLVDVSSQAAAGERNKIYDYVIRNFPEFEDGFGGIYVGSIDANGQGNRDGYPFDPSGPSLAPDWEIEKTD